MKLIESYVFMAVICILAILASFLFFRNAPMKHDMGVVTHVNLEFVRVCTEPDKCQTYDMIAYEMNNVGLPVVGEYVWVYDCYILDVCGMYEMGFSTVPALQKVVK